MSATSAPAARPPPIVGLAPHYARAAAILKRGTREAITADESLALAKALETLGLSGPALELLDPVAARAQSRPTGVVEWNSLRSNFDRNLAALEKRPPRTPIYRDALERGLRSLDLFRCRDGNWQLSRRVGNGPRRWLPELSDWRANVQRAPVLPAASAMFCYPYVLEGIGFGELLERVLAGTQRMFLDFSPRVHVLEPNLAQFAAWMHVDDHTDAISAARVHFWIGPAAAHDLAQFYRDRDDLVPPRQVFRMPRWGAPLTPPIEPTLDQLLAERDAQTESLRGEIIVRATARSENPHSRIVANAAPLRIFGITSRFTTFLQHSMRDIGQALVAAGHEFRLLVESDPHTHGIQPAQALRQIRDFDPDLIVLIDHNRHEFPSVLDLPIPCVNWIQDELPHLFAPDAGRALRSDDFIVGFITPSTARRSGYPPDQCSYVPMPVSPRVFSAEPVDATDLRRLACDVSFVSNCSSPPDRFVIETRARFSDKRMHRLIDALHDVLAERIAGGRVPSTPQQTEGIIRRLARDCGLAPTDGAVAAYRREWVDRLINIHFRQQPLVRASELGVDLRLYGRGWEAHPQLARHACGVADHGYHLRAIFQASKVSLQLHPSGGIHQRLLEGLSSGGRFLIRGTPANEHIELYASVARRVVESQIDRTPQLLETPNPILRRDAALLAETLFSPAPPNVDWVEHLAEFDKWASRLDMAASLPRFREVRFGSMSEFDSLLTSALSDAGRLAEIASAQRACVLQHYTYDAVVDSILSFIRQRLTPPATPIS